MKIPKGFKRGIIPAKEEQGILIICKKCKFKYYYYGSARPEKKLKCDGCKLKKKERKKKGFVKRNPRIIKRN